MIKLLLQGGGEPAQELPLSLGLSRVGRSDDNDIQIEHSSVSGCHCEITSAADSIRVKDLGSTNGTFIEGRPVQEASLAHGQRLQLGSVELILDTSGAVTPPVQAASAPTPELPKPGLSVRLSHDAAAAADAQASVAAAPSPRKPHASTPYQANPGQVEQEARSKMFWGDAPEEVVKYLRMQGLSLEEATNLGNTLLQERVSTLRRVGIRKILTGIVLMCVPVASFFIFTMMIGFLPLKLFAMTVLVGLWGAYMVLKGTFMVLAPKMDFGDVADL